MLRDCERMKEPLGADEELEEVSRFWKREHDAADRDVEQIMMLLPELPQMQEQKRRVRMSKAWARRQVLELHHKYRS